MSKEKEEFFNELVKSIEGNVCKSPAVISVIFDGKILKLGNKTAWVSVGAAKNALRLRVHKKYPHDHLAALKELEDAGRLLYLNVVENKYVQ